MIYKILEQQLGFAQNSQAQDKAGEQGLITTETHGLHWRSKESTTSAAAVSAQLQPVASLQELQPLSPFSEEKSGTLDLKSYCRTIAPRYQIQLVFYSPKKSCLSNMKQVIETWGRAGSFRLSKLYYLLASTDPHLPAGQGGKIRTRHKTAGEESRAASTTSPNIRHIHSNDTGQGAKLRGEPAGQGQIQIHSTDCQPGPH